MAEGTADGAGGTWDRPSGAGRMPQVDAIRGLAALAVVAQHYGQDIFGIATPLGYWGVRLFFVLSGFLIGGILLRARMRHERGDASLKTILLEFYVSRGLRIFPLYYLVIFGVLVFDPTKVALPWHLSYTTNLYFTEDHEPIDHTWSLAAEVQFYLVWPFVLLLTPRRWLVPVLLALVVATPLFRFWGVLSGVSRVAYVYTLPGCIDTFALGTLLALGRQGASGEEVGRSFGRAAWIALPVWVVVEAVGTVDAAWAFHARDVLRTPAMGIVLVWIVGRAAVGMQGPLKRWLELRVLRELGVISYGLYLIHFYVPEALARMGWAPQNHFVTALLSTAIAIGLASLTFYGLERPINRLRHRALLSSS